MPSFVLFTHRFYVEITIFPETCSLCRAFVSYTQSRCCQPKKKLRNVLLLASFASSAVFFSLVWSLKRAPRTFLCGVAPGARGREHGTDETLPSAQRSAQFAKRIGVPLRSASLSCGHSNVRLALFYVA